MIPEKFKQTSQNVSNFSRDRLSNSETSKVSDLEEQIAYAISLLAEAGVPESFWTSIVQSCYAKRSQNLSTSINNVAPQKITIIGGRGRMGRFFTHQFAIAGHIVSVLENEDWERADELLGSADLVMVSVPIECTTEAIERAAQYLTPTTALCDITSLKVKPVQAMLDHHSGPVMGLHPMFGPNVKSFADHKVVVCPGRDEESFQWLLELVQDRGGEVIVSTPEEHDLMMVIIQATRHFSRFSFGVFLAQEKVDIERSLLMSSPSYRQEIEIIKRLFTQNPNLCVDIMLATPERCQAIARLADTYNRIAMLLARKDREGLIKEFETNQSFFTQETTSSNQTNFSSKKHRENTSFLKLGTKNIPRPLTIDG
ncbi:bifunctional chorismate mutase/prephenate dehydrogenase [Scytonema sp. NUACC26]|uniref:bifunctional chorismate mutase/prephenate dehydrogenase n=1 Tax=Scytonema sp. NUACC26 TaxID=3140176 RepID=UPI0034DC0C12